MGKKISEAEKKNLENRELNEKIIKNTIEIQELSKENEKVLNENALFREKIENKIKNFKEKILELEEAIKDKDIQISYLEGVHQQNSELEIEVNRLHQEIEKLTLSHKEKNEKIGVYEKKISNLTNENQKLLQDLQILIEKYELLEAIYTKKKLK